MMARENDPDIMESVQEHQQQLQQGTDQPTGFTKRNLEDIDEFSPMKMPVHTSMPDDPKKKKRYTGSIFEIGESLRDLRLPSYFLKLCQIGLSNKT